MATGLGFAVDNRSSIDLCCFLIVFPPDVSAIPVAPEAVWQVTRRHINLKFGMAAPYQSDEIWAVDSQEDH